MKSVLILFNCNVLCETQNCVRPNAHGVIGGAHGVMVIVIGNGHSNTSSNPGRD